MGETAMKFILFVLMFLVIACGDHDSATKDSIRERQELEEKVASLNQVIKEMADEVGNLQAEIDTLNGMLANCEKAESARPLPAQNESEQKSAPAEVDRQQRLLDYLENLENRKK